MAVTGDRVIYFLRYLHYPESFTHTLRWHRSRGNLIALTANAITVVLGIVLLAVLLFGAARRDLHWRSGWIPAVLVAGVYLLNYLNEIPLRIATMEPDQTWGAFWVGTVAVTLLGSLVAGLQILLIIAAAEWVYRKAFPQAIPLQHWFTRRGWAHPEGRKRVVLGYWLLAIHLLYIVAFLAVARRLLGAWAPATVPYDDLMSTAAPWAYPMLTAIEASVQEEFLFRVFLISLFARYLRSVWMGILVSAVVWSALHCSYPTVPYYLRAVELIPIGILWGWFVASFGPIPSMIAHALYNAAISSDIFLYSAGFLPKLSFAVVVLFILLPAALVWRWSRHPAADALLSPATDEAAETLPPVVTQPTASAEEPLPEREVAFPALSPRTLWLSILALGAIVLLSYGWSALEKRQQRFTWAEGESNPLQIRQLDARQAIREARRYLPQRGKEVQRWQCAAAQLDSEKEEDYDYLRRFLSRTDADALWARVRSPDDVWAVRWWKPGTREEWWVVLTADGKFWERYCRLPEEFPGKKIGKEQAQRLATQALRELGFPLERMRLVDSASQELPARSFHSFFWQVEGLAVGQAQFHLAAFVEGDVVATIYHEVNAPSSYLFQKEKFTARQAAGAVISGIVALILLFWSWQAHIRLMRQPGIPWRRMLLPAGVVSALPPLLLVLNLPALPSSSPSTLSPQMYLLAVAFGVLVLSALLFFSLWQFAPYIPAWRKAFPDFPDPIEYWRALTQPRAHRRVWREAIVAQAAVLAATGLLVLLVDTVELLTLPGGKGVSIPDWMLQWRVSDTESAYSIRSYSPALCTLATALLVGLLAFWGWLGLVIGAKVMFGSWRRFLMWSLLLLVPVALLLDEAWQSAQYLVGLFVFFGMMRLLYRWVLRWNPLTLFVLGVHSTLLIEGYALLYYERHRHEGILLWLVVVGFLLWALVSWWRDRRQGQRERPVTHGYEYISS